MAVTGTLLLDGTLLGLPNGSQRVLLAWAITNGVGQVNTPLTLAAGDNTIAVPAGTTLIAFVPPTTNTQILTLKGAGPDTGLPHVNKTTPSLWSWDSTAANLIINAAAQVTGCLISFY